MDLWTVGQKNNHQTGRNFNAQPPWGGFCTKGRRDIAQSSLLGRRGLAPPPLMEGKGSIGRKFFHYHFHFTSHQFRRLGGEMTDLWSRQDMKGKKILDLFKAIFLLCTMVNHHQTTIWENIFATFSKHQKTQIQEKEKNMPAYQKPGSSLCSFRCSTKQQWSSSITGSCLVWNVVENFLGWQDFWGDDGHS